MADEQRQVLLIVTEGSQTKRRAARLHTYVFMLMDFTDYLSDSLMGKSLMLAQQGATLYSMFSL
jgi:hypothetical protein